MTEAPYGGQAQIEIGVAAAEFPAAPGSTTTIPVLLSNRGTAEDVVTLTVGGIPGEWLATPPAFITLGPGQQQQVALAIQPPSTLQSRAGQYPIQIGANSQATGGQVAMAACTLTVGAQTGFSSAMHPQRLAAGKPGQVTVENQGNVEEAFTLTWRGDNDDLLFNPGPTQELRVPAGGRAAAEFRAKPRSRPLFGGQTSHPFTAHVESPEQQTQSLSGTVVSQGLLPGWLLTAGLIVILVGLCLGVVGLVVGTGILDQAPAEPAAPAEPVAPVEPAAPEQPPEEPAEPAAPEEPAEPPAEGGEAPPAEGVVSSLSAGHV
jgi:hypothetical protein